MPQVQVTQDPLAVFVIVTLIGGAALLALLFAGPWIARVPAVPRPEPEASAADIETSIAPEVTPAPAPWSSGSSTPEVTPEPPRTARPEDAGQSRD